MVSLQRAEMVTTVEFPASHEPVVFPLVGRILKFFVSGGLLNSLLFFVGVVLVLFFFGFVFLCWFPMVTHGLPYFWVGRAPSAPPPPPSKSDLAAQNPFFQSLNCRTFLLSRCPWQPCTDRGEGLSKGNACERALWRALRPKASYLRPKASYIVSQRCVLFTEGDGGAAGEAGTAALGHDQAAEAPGTRHAFHLLGPGERKQHCTAPLQETGELSALPNGQNDHCNCSWDSMGCAGDVLRPPVV